MASFRKSVVNKQQKSAYTNGGNNNTDSKFKGRTGFVVPNRVFVGGICPTATESDLFSLFEKYGAVKACKIVSDQNGSPKGYGFVTFEKAEDVVRLQNDAKNLVFNEKRLNVGPAVVKQNPPYVSRYAESYVMPVTPKLYFTNNLPYQYQEGTTVYPNNPYAPPLTVMPAISDAPYYHQNNYGIPATPYQGAALFYPVPPNTSPVMVGPQTYSSYQPVCSSNSSYVYSSPVPATSSPSNSTAKNSNAMTTAVTNSTEIHAPPNTPVITAMPPNVSSLPPPLPYQFSHPPQYHSIMPPYSGEVYYNMVQGCYPMMTVNGSEAYIGPYYDVSDSCSNNIATAEEVNCESSNGYQTNPGTMQQYTPEMNGCDSSSTSVASNDCKPMPPMGPPPVSDHAREPVYSPENNSVPPVVGAVAPQTPAGQSSHAPTDYGSSAYIHHRSATFIYPGTPIPQSNVYFNSVYMADTANPSMNQCPYSKNLSEHFVSDHLPKRDSRYPPKKFNPSQAKDIPPNIPKFPFFVNNNHPNFVNRNMKDKDFRNVNGKNTEQKPPQRPVRHLGNGNNNNTPKPRVFHNQNQYGGPPRPMKSDRNGPMIPPNTQYARNVPGSISRQVSYEHAASTNPYEYQNNYQPYSKNAVYDGYRRQGQQTNNHGGNNNNNNNNNSCNYRNKYEKVNGPSNETEYTKTGSADLVNTQTEANRNPASEEHSQTEQNTPAISSMPAEQQHQQEQVCAEMQNLAL